MLTIRHFMPRATPAAGRAAFAALAALILAACGEAENGTDPFSDTGRPTVDALRSDAEGNDTTVSFNVVARDNLGIKYVSVSLTGNGVNGLAVDTIRTAMTEFTKQYNFPVSSSIPPGTSVLVVATAMDGAGNLSVADSLRVSVGNLREPAVYITSPRTNTAVVIGKSVVLSISGGHALKVRAIGYTTSGVYTTTDSVAFTSPLRDSVSVLDTLTVPDTTDAGPLTVTPFVVDSVSEQRTLGDPITINVQTHATANTRPLVGFGLTPRIEVTDTMHVEASDATGIATLGYEVRSFEAPNAVISADSLISTGNFTSLPATFQFRLPVTTFPTRVLVSAFATNTNGVREYALVGSATRQDTVVVVAGVTRPLPNGGRVADAYYHARKDRMYLTNLERNTLEVFSLTDSSFKEPIIVGSRPWGLTPWPRDRAGEVGDTLLVANSGGTNVSYVNLNGAGSGREVYRYPLPNIFVYSVTSTKSALTGEIMQQRTIYDFSDRPQFIAATCVGDSIPSTVCGDVKLVYSTTPTGGQSKPFEGKGTVRWENLMTHKSHFFFEHAMGQGEGRSDTLAIDRYAAQGVGIDEPLLREKHYAINGTDTLEYSVIARLEALGFRDTTHVRNSANFRRSIVGEGGPVLGSRAVMYDVVPGFESTFTLGATTYTWDMQFLDNGVSSAYDVSDYVANTFASVKGVSINFDGSLSAIRADSTYLVDPTLRLQGLLQTSGGNAGFDFHPRNTGLMSADLLTRLAFAASSEPQIEIYDTHCYQRVSAVPVRDPIIGPIKSAVRPNGQIVLIGATTKGATIVSLPNNFTTNCP
jgi:hypothetical protein